MIAAASCGFRRLGLLAMILADPASPMEDLAPSTNRAVSEGGEPRPPSRAYFEYRELPTSPLQAVAARLTGTLAAWTAAFRCFAKFMWLVQVTLLGPRPSTCQLQLAMHRRGAATICSS